MSAMSLEAEKNELIRRILDVDDVAILRRVKSMLSCEEEQTNVVAKSHTCINVLVLKLSVSTVSVTVKLCEYIIR